MKREIKPFTPLKIIIEVNTSKEYEHFLKKHNWTKFPNITIIRK
jgi:hypothetical protein